MAIPRNEPAMSCKRRHEEALTSKQDAAVPYRGHVKEFAGSSCGEAQEEETKFM